MTSLNIFVHQKKWLPTSKLALKNQMVMQPLLQRLLEISREQKA